MLPLLAWSVGPNIAVADDGPAASNAAAAPSRYKVTVVGAHIAATRPDGSPWHVEPPNELMGALTTMALASFSGPVALAAGSMVKGDAKLQPPSPQVRLLVGGEQIETFPLSRTSNPTWGYSFVIEAPADRSDSVHVVVLDAEDGQEIGRTKLPFEKFVAKRGFTLEDVGSADLVQFKVEPLGKPEASTAKFIVDGKANIDSLAKEVAQHPRAGVAGDWRGVPVLNGDFVRIRATGQVCPNNGTICGGPEGISRQRKDWQSYNRSEFKGGYHAALVGMLAGKSLYVGRWLEFRAPAAGTLLLGVNDNDVSNNSGTFQVEVEINPPDLVAAGSIGSCGYVLDHMLLLLGTDGMKPAEREAILTQAPNALRVCGAAVQTNAERKCAYEATTAQDFQRCGTTMSAMLDASVPSCAVVATHLRDVMMAEDAIRNAPADQRQAVLDSVATVVAGVEKECQAGHWTPAQRTCLTGASFTDLDKCGVEPAKK